MTKAAENRFAKIGALGVLAALDYRKSIEPGCTDDEREQKLTRVAHVLGHLQGIVETNDEIHAAVKPELVRLGKLLGFEVIDKEPVITVPGNREKH